MDMTLQLLDIIAPIERSVGVHRIQDTESLFLSLFHIHTQTHSHVHSHAHLRDVTIQAQSQIA